MHKIISHIPWEDKPLLITRDTEMTLTSIVTTWWFFYPSLSCLSSQTCCSKFVACHWLPTAERDFYVESAVTPVLMMGRVVWQVKRFLLEENSSQIACPFRSSYACPQQNLCVGHWCWSLAFSFGYFLAWMLRIMWKLVMVAMISPLVKGSQWPMRSSS